MAEQTNDPKLFKKLQGEIWEFRSQYLGNQNRLLAFWDKTEATETLVLATHGFIKRIIKFQLAKSKEAERIREDILKTKI